MKTLTLNSEHLGAALDRLWAKGEELNFTVTLNPGTQQIKLTKDGEQLALVNVAHVVDDYDLVHELFN